jgi:hypothetical protein
MIEAPDPWDITPFPLRPSRYVVMTDAGEIAFASFEQMLAYQRARRKSERANRWLTACAFAAVLAAVAIEGWRLL